LNKLSFVLIAILLALISFDLAAPVFANKPEIRNVAVLKIGNRYSLNITIYHTVENSTHYVDTVRVDMGYYPHQNITDMTIDPQSLSEDFTFSIIYDIGVLPQDPIDIGVSVRCTYDSWSDPWNGSVPEFPLPIILVGFLLVTSLAVITFRKTPLRP
jgi:hypothetical protein